MGKRITKRAWLIAVAAVLSVRITLAAGSSAAVVDCGKSPLDDLL
jgi:hypothetical protein